MNSATELMAKSAYYLRKELSTEKSKGESADKTRIARLEKAIRGAASSGDTTYKMTNMEKEQSNIEKSQGKSKFGLISATIEKAMKKKKKK